jgi:SPW repeat
MTKPISARVHGVLDYAVAAVFLNAPMVFGFQHTTASIVAYWLTGIHLLLTACTDFPPGPFKWIPLKIHGAIELLAALFVLAAPWILGFSGQPAPRNFFVAMGIVILLAVALSDYTVRETLPPRQPGDRRRWGTREPAGGETPKTT